MRHQSRAVGRGTKQPGMRHPVDPCILDKVALTAGQLDGDVRARNGLADNGVLLRRLGRSAHVEIARELAATDQRAEIELLAAIDGLDNAIADGQLVCGDFKLPGCHLKDCLPRGGGGLANDDSRHADRRRRGGDALIWHHVGITGDNAHLRKRRGKLLGADLLEGSQDAVADLHAPGKEGDVAILVDAQPAVELRGKIALLVGGPLRIFRLFRSGERRSCPPRQREADHDGPSALQEATTGNDGAAHDVVTPSLAARFTARRMRVWVPQRQRLPASALRISSSPGLGLSVSRAWALIIMPEMQYPHCAACSSINALCTTPGAFSSPNPSSVVISRSTTAETGVRQDRMALPSASTVQAPHWARPQPNFGPFRSSW